MKKGIHPKYFDPASITCSCGAVFQTGSTVEKMTVEICSQCHPFYTGKKKIVDATGRVERFKKLSEKSAEKKLDRRSAGKKVKISAKTENAKKDLVKKTKKSAKSKTVPVKKLAEKTITQGKK